MAVRQLYNNNYVGLEAELPSTLPSGSRYIAEDTKKLFGYDENDLPFQLGDVTQADIPQYTLSPVSGSNQINLLENGNVVSTIDLSTYLDDTNLARITSGTVDSLTGLATFVRDDSSTFVIDFSSFLDTVKSLNDLSDVVVENQSLYMRTSDPDGNETRGNNNIVIGDAGVDGVGDDNILIGNQAGNGVGNDGGNNNDRNVLVGVKAGSDLAGGDDNVMIGFETGQTNRFGNRNILIGSQVDTDNFGDSDKLNIGNIVKGDLTTNIVELEKLQLTQLNAGTSSDEYLTIDSVGNVNKIAVAANTIDILDDGGALLNATDELQIGESLDFNTSNNEINTKKEIGTFVPVIQGHTSGGLTYTSTSATGNYFKQGNIVYFDISISGINTTGTPGSNVFIEINDLPFFSKVAATRCSARLVVLTGFSFTSTLVNIQPYINKGTSRILFTFSNGSTPYSQPNTALREVNISNGLIQLCGSYTLTL